jgi:hypothetical protein
MEITLSLLAFIVSFSSIALLVELRAKRMSKPMGFKFVCSRCSRVVAQMDKPHLIGDFGNSTPQYWHWRWEFICRTCYERMCGANPRTLECGYHTDPDDEEDEN